MYHLQINVNYQPECYWMRVNPEGRDPYAKKDSKSPYMRKIKSKND